MNSNLEAKTNKYKKVSVTLSSGTWSGNSVPYTYTITNEFILATTDIQIAPSEQITESEATVYMNACIMTASQENGSITLKSFGTKPTSDIPIVMLLGDEVVE